MTSTVVATTTIVTEQATCIKREVEKGENIEEGFQAWVLSKEIPQYRYSRIF